MKATMDICHQVERLLHEQGQYTPLELLMMEGRLSYDDYEQWRDAESTWLEDTLFGDPQRIVGLLESAAGYARQLDLLAEPLRYLAWGAEQSKPLVFSQDQVLNQLFHTGYRRSGDEPQLDLFLDASATHYCNDIVQALSARDQNEAERHLERLSGHDPGHILLGDLERLVEAGARLNMPVDKVPDELQWLENEIVPLAEERLRTFSRDFLVPYWRRLTGALEGRVYDPAESRLHASYSASQALDWAKVCAVVEAEEGWDRQPELLKRYAVACEHVRRESQAWSAWFLLCWRFPQQAQALGEDGTPSLRQEWRRFDALEPVLAFSCFPAWLLLQRPGLINTAPSPEKGDVDPGCYAYRLLFRLSQHRLRQSSTLDNEVISLRAELQTHNPALFAHYMTAASSA
jgi:hypothetical protein